MNSYEVAEPILSSPFAEPREHWYICEGEEPERRQGRRPAVVFPPRDQRERWNEADGTLFPSSAYPGAYDLALVNLIRERVADWRRQDYPGVTRTTMELLRWWGREGRQRPLFFAQREAAETILFLTEARADFLQGINVPRDEPSDDQKGQGFKGFLRYACKMATGAGKTTVMAMLAAWSILNKINDRNDGRFSDVVLVVCPNVTIRGRLRELDPREGDASIYRTRDLVPVHLMPTLTQGHVLVMNWHVFEPQGVQVAGDSARVVKAGRAVQTRETITIGPKTTTARGTRYLTREDYERQLAAGLLRVLREHHEKDGGLKKVEVESFRHVESDTALVNRLLGREVGGKRNVLVMNDEAHHAYRIRREPEEDGLFDDEEEAKDFVREATVWVEGLDRIHKLRGVNVCIDLSATPYYLGAVGRDAGRPFPWVVSDFGLIDAIESGLVKVPQLAVRDVTGAATPAYFNIWQWIMPQLTAAERGGRKANPKPEAILKYANHPIAMLGGLWEREREEWEKAGGADPRPPVFILVCKNTQLAKVVYEWLAEDRGPANIPPAGIEGFRNRDGRTNTIRVDSKVVHETDTGQAKTDEARWMRVTLDTVGRLNWPADGQGRPIYPDGFVELAEKLKRPLHPPGRDVRCIVSVGMLTEGWDCCTVTHIIGLRPFMSQLLCEQVVGRGLRRRNYEVGDDGLLNEEVAQVLGVPFEVIPFKATKAAAGAQKDRRHHVHAIPSKAKYEIRFPRVEGYTQTVRNRVTVDWPSVPALILEPGRIPPEVEVKALSVNNQGRMTLSGPGRIDQVKLDEFRARHRLQELVFDMARALTLEMCRDGDGVPPHVLFPQLAPIIRRYLDVKVLVHPPADKKDVFLSPYYGWVMERLRQAIRPDTSQGEAAEVPRYEKGREPGSTADVDYWTAKEVREARRSHLNYIVADTAKWEQSAAYLIDTHPAVEAFAKNAGLGFSTPYLHNGQDHDYYPDFLIRLKCDPPCHVILETKGYDDREEVKWAAAERWVAAVNAERSFGRWQYVLVKKVTNIVAVLNAALANVRSEPAPATVTTGG
jgi:type III restriction enzyme